MKTRISTQLVFVVSAAVCALTGQVALSQAPPGAPQLVQAPPGGGRGGRGGLPGATPEQTQAVNDMNAGLAALMAVVTTARNELATATFADVKSEAAIRAAVDRLKAAELALATGRADAFEKLQASSAKLSAEQVTALVAAGGTVGGGGRAGAGRGRGAAGPGRGRG